MSASPFSPPYVSLSYWTAELSINLRQAWEKTSYINRGNYYSSAIKHSYSEQQLVRSCIEHNWNVYKSKQRTWALHATVMYRASIFTDIIAVSFSWCHSKFVSYVTDCFATESKTEFRYDQKSSSYSISENQICMIWLLICIFTIRCSGLNYGFKHVYLIHKGLVLNPEYLCMAILHLCAHLAMLGTFHAS